MSIEENVITRNRGELNIPKHIREKMGIGAKSILHLVLDDDNILHVEKIDDVKRKIS